MRALLPCLLIGLAIATGCHKNDVDVDDLDSNPFDPEGTSQVEALTIGPIVTAAYAQGVYNKQTVQVQVHPEVFPARTEYELHFIELTDPDTTVQYSLNTTSDSYQCENFVITLGTEYCYRFELVIGGEVVERQERCQIAEL